MSHETAFEKPATLGQLKDIIATLVQAIPPQLSSDDAQRIIEDKGWLVSEVQKLFAWRRVQEQFDLDAHLAKARADMMITDNSRGTAFQIEEWSQFYRDVFDLDVHYSEVNIFMRRPCFNRLIVVAQGLTLKHVIEVARNTFPSISMNQGDISTVGGKDRGTHDRLPTDTYAVLVRDQIEPDSVYNDMRRGC